LDVKDIRFVINYDFPTQMEEYVHRVGRTGRAGATGTSFTFFTEEDGRFAKDLIKILAENHQKIPDELYNLVHDRRFREKMMRFDKGSNRDAKGFEDYEKDGPSRKDNGGYRPPHYAHSENHDRGAIHRTHYASRPSYPQNFQTTIPNPPTTNTTMSAINPMYNNQQQLTPQQYALMAQMHMMQVVQQQFPSGQVGIYSAQPGQSQNGMILPGQTIDPKKETDDKNKENNQDSSAITIMVNPSTQNNGNSYYRDLYNSHGNSFYSQQNGYQSHAGTNVVKRSSGTSRFSDAKPAEQNDNSGRTQGDANYQNKDSGY
jgi:superfamily II DNA/RNA helicase